MEYRGDIGLYLSGMPVPLPQCGLFITQPKVRDIVQFGETKFLMAAHLLSDLQDFAEEVRMGNSELANRSDFQILLIVIANQPDIKDYFDTFFELIFPTYQIEYTNQSIDFKLLDSEDDTIKGMINPFTFELFQSTIKELFIASGDNEEEYNPANDAAREIAEKLKKAREKKAQEKGESNVFMFGSFASILAIGLQMDINIFYNYTPFQLYDAYRRY